MPFYRSISAFYDFIFPFNNEQVKFICTSINGTASKKLLDIGCGSGNLSIELSNFFNAVTAIDIDETMLKKAKEKSHGVKNLSFNNTNMLNLTNEFKEKSFDCIIC